MDVNERVTADELLGAYRWNVRFGSVTAVFVARARAREAG